MPATPRKPELTKFLRSDSKFLPEEKEWHKKNSLCMICTSDQHFTDDCLSHKQQAISGSQGVNVYLFVYFLICVCVTARAKPHSLAPAYTALVQHREEQAASEGLLKLVSYPVDMPVENSVSSSPESAPYKVVRLNTVLLDSASSLYVDIHPATHSNICTLIDSSSTNCFLNS